MSAYAVIDKNTDEVVNIIEASVDNVNEFYDASAQYIILAEGRPVDNYPILKGLYDKDNDLFKFKVNQLGPKRFPSWLLDNRNVWVAPVPNPDPTGCYEWNEQTITWDPCPQQP